jgi:pantoate--beta-alanine ligase
MNVCTTIAQFRSALKQLQQDKRQRAGVAEATVGFVPTMGYLHAGHGSLLARARQECEIVVLSIFVNPLQFAPGEDLTIYPRDEQRDLAVATQFGVDLVFMPTVAEMYPSGAMSLTTVRVTQVTEKLCGASRPGHFAGVATVVSKLFHIVQPDKAYFGLKDAQQVAVIEQMVDDLNFPVAVVACPTMREPDGLALSSRNVYLSAEERAAAPVIARTLAEVDAWLEDVALTFPDLKRRLTAAISAQPLAVIDYIECLQYPSFADLPNDVTCAEWLAQSGRPVLLAVAVKFGKTRLIDNRLLGGGHRV